MIHRGNNRGSIFSDAADREVFLSFLKHGGRQLGVSVHGFALMTNHSHLIGHAGGMLAMPQTMKELGVRYVELLQPQAPAHRDVVERHGIARS